MLWEGKYSLHYRLYICSFLMRLFAFFSIIAAEASIANVVGMTQMNPPVKDLCMLFFSTFY